MPSRDLAAQLAPLELQPVRQHRARERDADGRARAEVPRAADDLARLALADVDLAELQAVGVRGASRPRRHVPTRKSPRLPSTSATPTVLDARPTSQDGDDEPVRAARRIGIVDRRRTPAAS